MNQKLFKLFQCFFFAIALSSLAAGATGYIFTKTNYFAYTNDGEKREIPAKWLNDIKKEGIETTSIEHFNSEVSVASGLITFGVTFLVLILGLAEYKTSLFYGYITWLLVNIVTIIYLRNYYFQIVVLYPLGGFQNLKRDYDLSDLLFYVILPLVVYFIYKKLKINHDR